MTDQHLDPVRADPVRADPVLPEPVRPALAYGQPETQFGIVVEHRADGGVKIIIPGTGGRAMAKAAEGSSTLVRLTWVVIAHLIGRATGKRTMPRAIIQLSRRWLVVVQPGGENEPRVHRRRWRLELVGEIRPNRYSNGVYVRIPGQDNFDLLQDLPPKLVQYVGRTLEQALERLRATASRP